MSTDYAQKSPHLNVVLQFHCVSHSTNTSRIFCNCWSGVSYIDCHSHRNAPTYWVDPYNDDGCPLHVANMWHLDATCSQDSVAANFHCHLKTSVTRFPLPLEIERRRIWFDTRNPLCLKRTEPKNKCDTHSAYTQKLQSLLFNSHITNVTGHWARDTQSEKRCIQWLQWELHSRHKCHAQSYMHRCLSHFNGCRQTSHNIFQRHENFEQSARVSLFGNFIDAALNCAFTVNNIVCHAQYCFPSALIVWMQLRANPNMSGSFFSKKWTTIDVLFQQLPICNWIHRHISRIGQQNTVAVPCPGCSSAKPLPQPIEFQTCPSAHISTLSRFLLCTLNNSTLSDTQNKYRPCMSSVQLVIFSAEYTPPSLGRRRRLTLHRL